MGDGTYLVPPSLGQPEPAVSSSDGVTRDRATAVSASCSDQPSPPATPDRTEQPGIRPVQYHCWRESCDEFIGAAPHPVRRDRPDGGAEPSGLGRRNGQSCGARSARTRPRRSHVHRLERARSSYFAAEYREAVWCDPRPDPVESDGRALFRVGRGPRFIPDRMTPSRRGPQ